MEGDLLKRITSKLQPIIITWEEEKKTSFMN